MRNIFGFLIASLHLFSSVQGAAQAERSATKALEATYITREEVEVVNKTAPGVDRNIRVVDIGHENLAVGVIHRGKTGKGSESGGGSAARPPGKPCGKRMEVAPKGGVAAGITHDAQTEVYHIISGGGTMFTDGYIVNGSQFDLPELNGPTCIGTAYATTFRKVRKGDIVIIPARVVHGWAEIPDHVDYLSFRPSPGILSAGWVNPAIRK